MELNKSCRCCLLRPSDKDLKKPYTCLGKTEIYAEMLKDCFKIHIPTLSGVEACGICEVCVIRLRDASAFKLQVQRCQAVLDKRLQGNLRVKEEGSLVKIELSDDNDGVEPPTNLGGKYKASHDPLPSDGDKLSGTEVQVEYKNSETRTTKVKLPAKDEFVSVDKTSHASQTNMTGNSTEADRQPCTCDTCGKEFAKKLNLINHMKVHNKAKVYTCEVCNNEFKRFKLLVAHKRVHKGEKPFNCGICNKRFRETSSLIIHNRIHTGETPFSCEICCKRFTQKRCLLSHKRTHAADAAKAYICSICNKGFTQKGNLKAHIRVHTGEKPFHCVTCNKQFNHQSSLNHHMRTHSRGKLGRNYKHSCKDCNKNFKTLFNLSCHERVHNGEKPYTCEVCNKQFGRKDHLDRHKWLHTGVKQFCCEICGKQFSEKSNLNAHKVVHSGLDGATAIRRRRRRAKRSRRDAAQPTPHSGDKASQSSDQVNSAKQSELSPIEVHSTCSRPPS